MLFYYKFFFIKHYNYYTTGNHVIFIIYEMKICFFE